MKLFKTSELEAISEKMDVAGNHFQTLINLKKSDEVDARCHLIAESMGDACLSDWFSFYIRIIFFNLHDAELDEQGDFLNAISNFNLNKLRSVILAQQRIINTELKKLQAQQKSWLSSSLTLHEALDDEQSSKVIKKITQLREELKQFENDTLSFLLLIYNVVFIIENSSFLLSPTFVQVIENIKREPLEFIRHLAPILKNLLNIREEVLLKKAMVSLDGAIHATLQLIGIDTNIEALVFLIRDEIFERKYLVQLEDLSVAIDKPNMTSS